MGVSAITAGKYKGGQFSESASRCTVRMSVDMSVVVVVVRFKLKFA